MANSGEKKQQWSYSSHRRGLCKVMYFPSPTMINTPIAVSNREARTRLLIRRLLITKSKVPPRRFYRQTNSPSKGLGKCANCGGPHTASFRGCPNFPKLKKTIPGQSYAAALQGNNKTSATTERPTITNGKQKTPINLNTEIIQEIPNPNELTDLFQLLKQVKKIMDRIPNIKEVLKKMENTESVTTKLFILAEALPQV
ncbi:hypothetical protein AVEN_222757-1 [Araneus ventricosus]|uniref:Pre-C2HC domain-containing protein n=1 Tax=Araneus ventricosus TaxID=182803 RepID=A0A4Y2AZQ5_ARAVE|nr:hypothetical protein AVEN_222757-1 [Araneus ventricosus]